MSYYHSLFSILLYNHTICNHYSKVTYPLILLVCVVLILFYLTHKPMVAWAEFLCVTSIE